MAYRPSSLERELARDFVAYTGSPGQYRGREGRGEPIDIMVVWNSADSAASLSQAEPPAVWQSMPMATVCFDEVPDPRVGDLIKADGEWHRVSRYDPQGGLFILELAER